MQPETIAHIIEAIHSSKNILLGAHHKIDADSAGSILALFHVLKKLGKNPSAVTYESIPKELEFLPGIKNAFKTEHKDSNNFVITLFNPGTTVEEVKYTTTDKGYLNIIITPKSGAYKPEDVAVQGTDSNYDLIMIVDCGDSKNIGDLYTKQRELFDNAVVVNIDHHKTNDEFGDINYLDTSASSACEQVYHILSKIDENLIDADVATCLLTGIIADTGSFKHSNSSATAFTVASKLVEKGARQQDIITNLFKKKKFSTLKIWGKILTHISMDRDHGILWSYVTKRELDNINASPEEVHGVIDELLTTEPSANWVLLFTELEEGTIKASIRTKSERFDGTALCTHFGGGGHAQACGYTLRNTTMEQVIEDSLSFLRSRPKHASKKEPEKQQRSGSGATERIAKKLEERFFGS